MKTEDIVKYALIAAGAYLVWEYVISPMMTGTTAAPAPVPVPVGTQPTQTTTVGTGSGTTTNTIPPLPQQVPPPMQIAPAPAPLSVLLTNLANGQTLNVDQWSYYYAQLPGRTQLTAQTMANLLNNAGITDTTRQNPMDVNTFINLLSGVGLSGMGDIVTGLSVMPTGMGAVPGRGGFGPRRKPNGFGGNNTRTSYVH